MNPDNILHIFGEIKGFTNPDMTYTQEQQIGSLEDREERWLGEPNKQYCFPIRMHSCNRII